MASNSIGNASLKLSTDSAELTSGLAKASKDVTSWASKLNTDIGSKLSGFGGSILSKLKAGIVGIGAAIVGAISEPLAKLGELGGIQKASSILGMSASQFQGLSIQLGKVGIEGDAVQATFAAMGKNVFDASLGLGKASKAFQQLGIDGEALTKLPLDEQFKAIADKIASLPVGAQQASAALHIFGGEGSKLLPILQKGGKGIQEFIDTAKSKGVILADSQIKLAADSVKAMKMAQEEIKQTWAGLVNTATIIAAPFVKFWGNVISKAFSFVQPIFVYLNKVMTEVAVIAEAVFKEIGSWVDTAVTEIKAFANEWLNFGSSSYTIGEVVKGVLKALAQGFAYVWDVVKAGIGVVEVGLGSVVKAIGVVIEKFGNLVGLVKELPDDIRPKWVDKFVDNTQALGKGISKFGDDMTDRGIKRVLNIGESAKKVGAWFDNLGKKAVDDIKKAGDKAAEQVEMIDPVHQKNAAVLKGSAEAYSIETAFKMKNINPVQDVAKQQLNVQKGIKQGIDKIANKKDLVLMEC